MEVVRCALEWEAGSDPVAGRLIAPDSSEYPFRGWLEFLTIAEAIRQRPAQPPRTEGEAEVEA